MALALSDKVSPAQPPDFDDRYEFLVLVAVTVLTVLLGCVLYLALDYLTGAPIQ
jgi:hypothetical protein